MSPPVGTGIFIVGAKRTPFGAFGGALKHLSATQLGVIATQASMAQAFGAGGGAPGTGGGLHAQQHHHEAIDEIYFGNVIQSSPDAAYLARHVGLMSKCGSIATPALTINRLCGSGFETVIQAANSIKLGSTFGAKHGLVVAGGTENMSAAPLTIDGNAARWGVKLGTGLAARDALWDGLTDSYAQTPMGVTAENLATKYHISRFQCDEFAIRSQEKWAAAHKAGLFQHEMAPVEIKSKKGITVIDTDEHPRATTVEKIGKLLPVFKKDGGVVTAANASGICDGAGTIILASEQAVQKYNLKPLARLVSYAVTGCDPTIMGIGPVDAIKLALHRAGDLDLLKDVDRLEINEAFAAQVLACCKELQFGDDHFEKLNSHGGAIALGHPLGASGSRIVAHLANEFVYAPASSKIHVGAACIGGGQGIAVVLERV
jgi:acetyl-CoA acyltransferase 2